MTRSFVRVCLLAGVVGVSCNGTTGAPRGPGGQGKADGLAGDGSFTVVEATIDGMQQAMQSGRVTSQQIVQQYLDRIRLYDPTLHATMALNPDALAEAAALDSERAAGHVRGPLHGIPVALKDLIQTNNMPTTGGVLAFKGYTPVFDAQLVQNLRAAGAIILAKTTLTELANWVGDALPDGYNAILGHSMNPYDPRPDPREGQNDGRCVLDPSASSSGGGTAANFWAANVGTETDGSILGPSNQNMLAAIKPTTGRLSREGIMPLTADQDTPGPMAKSVADAAILLGAMEGGPDGRGTPGQTCAPPPGADYRPFLDPNALRGARIGIPRAYFYDPAMVGGQPQGGLTKEQAALMTQVIQILHQQGAIIVDPVDIPSLSNPDPSQNFALWEICWQGTQTRGHDADCSTVLKYGFKRDFNAWLVSLGAGAPVHTLTDLRNFNLAHAAQAIRYGQEMLDISDDVDLTADQARYKADRAKDIDMAGAHGLDAAFHAGNLDAILFPAADGYEISARPGYPTVIVPFGTVPNAADPPFPAGFDPKPSPYGVSFGGLACSEPRLIAIAYAFEQATKRRVSPPSFP